MAELLKVFISQTQPKEKQEKKKIEELARKY